MKRNRTPLMLVVLLLITVSIAYAVALNAFRQQETSAVAAVDREVTRIRQTLEATFYP